MLIDLFNPTSFSNALNNLYIGSSSRILQTTSTTTTSTNTATVSPYNCDPNLVLSNP